MNHSGDHMMSTNDWSYVQTNILTNEANHIVTEATTPILLPTPIINNNADNDGYYETNVFDLMENINPTDWSIHSTVQNSPRLIENGNTTDYFNEGGDYNDVNSIDLHLDELSHMAVIDNTEESLHSSGVCRSCDFSDFSIEGTSYALPHNNNNNNNNNNNINNNDIDDNNNNINNINNNNNKVNNKNIYKSPALINMKLHGWYRLPYDEDFIYDINFMEDFWRPDRPLLRWAMADNWDNQLEETWISSLKRRRKERDLYKEKPIECITSKEKEQHECLLKIVDIIKNPEQVNHGMTILHEHLQKHPEINIRPYLEDCEFYLKRFVIWGLNYYECCKQGTILIPEETGLQCGSESKHDTVMKQLSTRMLQCQMSDVNPSYWNMLLDWFVDNYDMNMMNRIENVEKS